MSQSFVTKEKEKISNSDPVRRKVLVTGASGNIGSYFAEHLHAKYDLVLMEHDSHGTPEEFQKWGLVVQGDICDLERMKELCKGVDTVLHLAADASPSATWESVRDLNITGTYNTFVAAKAAKCRRVIYASSIHAVSGYPPDVQVKTSEAVNPGDLYGVSKCFGEALGRYMAEQEGLSIIALRIGAFQPHSSARKESGIKMLDAWVSQRDLNQLIERCIDAIEIQFAIFHALSDNRFKRLDISDARELVGYAPQDDATREVPQVKELDLPGQLSTHSKQDNSKKSGLRKDL